MQQSCDTSTSLIWEYLAQLRLVKLNETNFQVIAAYFEWDMPLFCVLDVQNNEVVLIKAFGIDWKNRNDVQWPHYMELTHLTPGSSWI